MAIVPVSRDVHAKMRLRPFTSYAFARTLPAIRMVVQEAAQAAANFPIVFLQENGAFAPFVLLGLAQGENLLVSDEGQWLGNYVPAMLRRYPFMLGRAPSADGQGEAMVMVEDTLLSEDEGEPLFGPDEGEPSGPVARAIRMLGEIDAGSALTARITQSIVDHDLLDVLPLQVGRGGGAPESLTGIHTISEAKLNALSDEAFLELRKSGGLTLAYAQLLSLGQFQRLQALASVKLARARTPQA